MGLFKRRPPQQEYAFSAEALWGALKVGLPRVTATATFYEEAHRVEWTMDATGFDWAELMSARVEASRNGSAMVTVAGRSAVGFTAATRPSIIGPGRRRTASATLLAAVSDVVGRFGEEVARVPATDGFRYWNGREWTLEPPPPPAPPPALGARS